MSWLKFLENSFGTKKKDRKKYKDGTLKPGRFEASLIEKAKRKTSKEKDPLLYLQDRIENSVLKEIEINTTENTDIIDLDKRERKQKKELAFERLIRMKYISRDPEVRERQIESITPWINYLKSLPVNRADMTSELFNYLVLRSILKYDLYWMDKNEDGSWKTGERSKNTKKEFPIFDGDITPEVLVIMREYLAILEDKDGPILDMMDMGLLDFEDDSEIYKAIQDADFRQLYFLIKKEIEKSRIKDEDVESKEGGAWLPPFSLKNCKTEEEKQKVARKLAKATEYARGFCIKSPKRAMEYLNDGDIYLYNELKTVKMKDGRIEKLYIPEIAIHVSSIGYINPKEVHGNADSQGIKKEYLPIAAKFIKESNFINKKDFETRFADAELYEIVKEKMEKKEDLNARELKFLYEIYRPVKLFFIIDIKNKDKNTLRGLRHGRIHARDWLNMFGIDISEIAIVEKEVTEKTKVFIGDFKYEKDGDLKNIEEITGKLLLEKIFAGVSGKINLNKLKKVSGIVLTEIDKTRITEGFRNVFPEMHDLRKEKIFY